MAKQIEIPRGKLVGTNGPGSIYIDTEGSSYIIGAVDKWYDSGSHLDIEDFEIRNSRLEKLLNVYNFRKVPMYITPDKKNQITNSNITIPITRFPLTHYCSHCHRLTELGEGTRERKRFCKNCKESREHVQFPLVIVCEHGHIYDFPYFDYAHKFAKYDRNVKHEVKFIKNGSSILNSSLICSCGAKHTLSGVTGQAKNNSETPFQREMRHVNCEGKRAWSDEKHIDNGCDGKPTAILKNALGVYQPELISILSLEKEENEKVNDYESILAEEFNKLSYETPDYYDKNLLNVKYSFHGTSNSIIKKVNAVRRLQELVVQTGFHRLSSSDEEDSFKKATEDDANKKMIFSSNNNDVNWYPAKELFGEGIFIELNSEVLENWQNQESVQNYNNQKLKKTNDNHLKDKFMTPISVLIHTLSHGLIKQFSKLSGYSITSIREKLYFQQNKYGLLLYVTDTDKDGTFGGLVRLAGEEKFKLSFNEALKSMDWCSSDPVCSEIGKENGQGLYSSNGAACHNCSYLPNTSCSFRNCYLDREFVFKTESEECISNYFNWFDDKKDQGFKVEILEKGQENTYGDWEILIDVGISNTSYFLDSKYSPPEYLEGRVKIDGNEYRANYIWLKEKRIVLLDEELQDKEISPQYYGETDNWDILKNK
ncbi:DUF1998 domain-containing protein [Staphylococcus aureus]